jgi:hypothetical protein
MAAVTSDLLALGNPERIRRAVPGAEVQWAKRFEVPVKASSR